MVDQCSAGTDRCLAEIPVVRRAQKVEGKLLMLEAHHRRGDRDAALALGGAAASEHLRKQWDADPWCRRFVYSALA
jgi:hypothetical protein